MSVGKPAVRLQSVTPHILDPNSYRFPPTPPPGTTSLLCFYHAHSQHHQHPEVGMPQLSYCICNTFCAIWATVSPTHRTTSI